MNLILLERSEVAPSGDVTLRDSRAAHMLRVLGVTPGAEVRVGVIDGARGTGTVIGIDGQAAPGPLRGTGPTSVVHLHCEFEGGVPARPAIDLLLALPRPKVLRRLWAQLAALGVGRIMLTNAERVERNYFDTHVLSPGCYRPLLIEGLQQARDTRLPQVSVHRRLKVLIEDGLDALCGDAARVVADPAAETSIASIAAARAEARLILAIGPEGGWSRFEVNLLQAHGFQPAGMGPRTLRTDTACIALLALAQEAWRGNGGSGVQP